MVDFEIEYKDRENTGIYRTEEIISLLLKEVYTD